MKTENRSKNGKGHSTAWEEGILVASKPIHPVQPTKSPGLEVLGIMGSRVEY